MLFSASLLATYRPHATGSVALSVLCDRVHNVECGCDISAGEHPSLLGSITRDFIHQVDVLSYPIVLSLVQAFSFVKKRRMIVSPNMAFLCQLVEWEHYLAQLRSTIPSIDLHLTFPLVQVRGWVAPHVRFARFDSFALRCRCRAKYKTATTLLHNRRD